MKYYFNLQFTRFNRTMYDIGLHPVLAVVLILLMFLGLSFVIFSRTTYAAWIYLIFPLLAIASLSAKERNDDLRLLFKSTAYHKLRIIENILVTIPFALFLMYQEAYVIALLAVPVFGFISLLTTRVSLGTTIPTPFKRMPFEFPVGCRNYLVLVLLSIFLLLKAMQVGNENLGLVSMGLLMLTCMLFASKKETYNFVWIYNKDARMFIWEKLLTIYIGTTLLILPVATILLLWHLENWKSVLAIYLVGNCFISAVLFAKYSVFPKEISLPHAVLFSLCVWFPPLLLIIAPMLFIKADKNLKRILG